MSWAVNVPSTKGRKPRILEQLDLFLQQHFPPNLKSFFVMAKIQLSAINQHF